MKKISFTIIPVLVALIISAQIPTLDVLTIPVALQKNAGSVKREEHILFEVKSINKAIYKVHKIVTVLNESGKEELVFQQFTDQFKSLESASIQLFDAKGNLIKKYRRSDLLKQTAGQGLVPDGQINYIELPLPAYPVTIQVDYEIKFNGLLNYPGYEVQLPEQAVENSQFVAIVPVDLDLRFKANNTNLTPIITGNEKTRTYTWSVKSMPALKEEEGSVSYESRYPHILLAPNKFELDGYPGDLGSWQNFGKWYGLLAKNADNLSEDRKQFFRAMVKDAKNNREKIELIYHYLQSNCRYVLISLGIGGFKPFDADFVDKKKYGDCKALSNYLQSCLKAVGIKSYQALINASYNKEPVDPAFPYNGFNHVIVCVPTEKDSVWLECTSNTIEFGMLGNFTENRNALLITEDGGKLVATPVSRSSENTFSSYSVIDLAGDGSGIVTVKLNTSGEYKQDLLNYINNQTGDDQKKFLVNYIGYMAPDKIEIKYNQVNKEASIEMRMQFEKIPEFIAGRKLFLNPRIYKIWNNNLPTAADRTQDFYFEHPFIKTDTTIYKLPAGFNIETLPKAKK